MSGTAKTKARLEVRQAKLKDVREIADLVSRAYVDLPPYTLGEIRGQLNNYRDGCFVAKLDGQIVGYCASMRLSENVAFSNHTWDEVTGNGFGSASTSSEAGSTAGCTTDDRHEKQTEIKISREQFGAVAMCCNRMRAPLRLGCENTRNVDSLQSQIYSSHATGDDK